MLVGSCLCKSVLYQADCDAQPIVHCHCETCRKSHGAAFSSVMAIPRESFSWTMGSEKLKSIESSPGKLRHFCSTCGSHLMAERVETQMIMLRLGCLDTQVEQKAIAHIWRSDGVDWYDPKDEIPEMQKGFE